MLNKIRASGLGVCRWCLCHKRWTAAILILAVLSITPVIIVTRTWFIVHTDARPSATPAAYALEQQTEGFTCGVHALSTVYKAYGLDPEAERIRWRLGVDTKAVAWLSDSTGALHPDMWMVLAQDYFVVDSVDLEAGSAWVELRRHLDTGHPAVLLIKRRENGNLHWVVAARAGEDDRIEVYDSLFDAPCMETPDFITDHVVTAMRIKPVVGGRQGMSSIDAHLAGMEALSHARKRINALESQAD